MGAEERRPRGALDKCRTKDTAAAFPLEYPFLKRGSPPPALRDFCSFFVVRRHGRGAGRCQAQCGGKESVSDDLGFDFASAAPWFPHEQDRPYVLVRISDEHAKSWANTLGLAVRRCYVSDSIVSTKAREHGVEATQIIAARMPDAGWIAATSGSTRLRLGLRRHRRAHRGRHRSTRRSRCPANWPRSVEN